MSKQIKLLKTPADVNEARKTLKRCPLCVGEATDGMVRDDEGGVYCDRWQVGCSACDVWLTVIATTDTEYPYTIVQNAFDKWNTRAEAESLRAEVEAYRVALHNLVNTVEKSSLIAAVWMGSGRRDAEVEQIVGAKNIATATLKEYAALKAADGR